MIPLLKNYFQAVMHKDEIITAFSTAAGALHRFIETQPDEVFEKCYDGKWSAGQHLDHMIRSVKPLNLAYRLPGWGLRLAFGKMNREARNYDSLVERYKSKLSKGAVATG
ncbi:MAG: DinB family protein, partial [Chitinophagaceae bacterium]|nr:DinB family protein [Chitinophagaceae bacterium]